MYHLLCMESSDIKEKTGFIKLGRILLKIGLTAFGTLGSEVQILSSRPTQGITSATAALLHRCRDLPLGGLDQ